MLLVNLPKEPAMKMNRIQFQAGMSMQQLYSDFGTESQCQEALERLRWPNGFHCPKAIGKI
jgi:hypothetical protein